MVEHIFLTALSCPAPLMCLKRILKHICSLDPMKTPCYLQCNYCTALLMYIFVLKHAILSQLKFKFKNKSFDSHKMVQNVSNFWVKTKMVKV